jgi:peptidylprolyl isomerase
MKYIIVLVVIIIGIMVIGFLIQNGKSLSTEFTQVAGNLSVPPGGDAGAQSIANQDEQTTTKVMETDTKKTTIAIFNTNMGKIERDLFGDLASNTVANFTKLGSVGFYDGTKFHRVIKGFMIQGGDPLSKDDSNMDSWGTGGPGYSFADEIHAQNRNDIGTISMANTGPNTNGSQFFINTANNNFLDTKHTVFGKVTAGMDVVVKIENTPTGPTDRPITAMVIESITIK